MKKGIVVLFCIMQFITGALGQTETNDAPGIIYLYRQPNFIGSAVKMKILMNEKPLISLKNGSMYKQEVPPGEYTISCKMSKLAKIKFTVEPGKSYYCNCYLVLGVWSGIPIIELEDSSSGQAIINGGALKNLDYKPISMARPTSRVGLFFGGGGGFENILMGYNDRQVELTLSTGGGVSFGAEYGYEWTRNFDLSFNLFYQLSAMTPAVTNGDASFSRIGITATPALIIPIKGGDYFRFKLGAGAGYYSMGVMEINALNAGGGNYVLNYSPTFGVHGSFVFEFNISEKSSFSFGLKYYNINYAYTSSGSTGISTDPKVNNPDGSGLDFVMGYYYHF